MNENTIKDGAEPSFFINKNIVNIGIDNAGAVASLDFNKYSHLLVAGATGTGKSTILKTIIYNLLRNSEPAPLSSFFIFIDLKRVELAPFKNMFASVFCDDLDESKKIIKKTIDIIDERYKKLESAGAVSIEDAHHLFEDIFLVIDEFSELILQDKTIEKYIIRISQIGRAAGVHLILCTQLPTAKIITNLINVNMSCKIALKVETWQNSKCILGMKGAERLDFPGHAILKNGINLSHFKAYKTPPEDIKKAVTFRLNEERKRKNILYKIKSWLYM